MLIIRLRFYGVRVIGRKLQIHMDDYGVGVRFICAVPQ
jgi:hypothetical protein